MALAPGSRLGAYEILSLIGSGGMGEVYRARDSRLNRDVAIKVLPADVAADHDRLARFEREAQVLASLNHPNIAQIHGVDDSSGTPALVMELVEGPTLADRIAKGPIPLDEALPIAKQIAEALEAAHEQGIIHRDLKPANIKVRGDGTVKVLDFGLAKAFDPVASTAGNATTSPTLSPHATKAGLILGTAAYMAPEQARGKAVDKRADIWAFGCVLYETLTSRRAFEGEDVSDTLAFILTKEPEWTPLPPETPTSVRRLLRRCLEKDRGRRLADIADARLDLEEGANQVTSAEATPVPRSARHAMLRGGCLGTIAGAAIVATLWLAGSAIRGRSVVEPAVFRSSILLPGAIANFPGSLALSPDGRRVAFVASDTNGRSQLWIRALDGLAAQPLPDTAGALTPFWAADSRWLAFVQNGKLKKIEATGGPAVTLADPAEPFGGGAWNRDDLILFSLPTGSLAQIRAAGGTPTTLADAKSNPKARSYVPSFLPDGRQFIFTQDGKSTDEPQAYIGSLDTTQVTPLPRRRPPRSTRQDYSGSCEAAP